MLLAENVQQFKELLGAKFNKHSKSSLCRFMLPLLDHVMADVQRFGDIEMLNGLLKRFTA